jgi:hypothetical protein
VLGPVIGRASNGDSWKRQLMLEDYKRSDGDRFRVNWPRWIFSVSVNRDDNIEGLHDQGYIHNGKKLINPLDSPIRTLQLGGDTGLSRGCFQTDGRTDGRSDDARGGVRDLDAL